MKETELQLISELMKNSRRSDRELAKVTGLSQPTVTRIRTKLEREGIIREYTMIPDFAGLGFELMSIIMYKLKPISSEELEELQRAARELDRQERRPYLMIMEGMGLDNNLVAISLHKTYSDYADYIQSAKNLASSRMRAYMNLDDVQGFLIDLKYEKHYQPITFSRVATHLQTSRNERK